MKALLRNFENEVYVTKELELLKNGTYQYKGEGISETNILAIIEGGKKGFVQCSNCGETIVNTKAAIKEHLERKSSHKGCMSCPNLRATRSHNQKVKYVENEDGTFHRVTNDDVTLSCGYSWHVFSIKDELKSDYCKYRNCTESTITGFDGFFDKYPNAFDDMITVDALKFRSVSNYNGYTVFDLKCRGNITAYVNGKGIVDHFRISRRYDSRTVYYSKKYNKLFYENRGKYIELKSDYYWPADKIDYIKKTIATLYE